MAEVITNQELINKFAEQAMKEPEETVTTRVPLGPEVSLPGGFIDNNELVTTVEVRELTGVDEEAIAKASTTGKALNVLLQRGLVKVGRREATKEDLDEMLSGDRDAALIGIRKVTFGETVDFKLTCQSCLTEQVATVNLTEDIPVHKLDDPINDRTWTVETKKGYVTLTLPTGVVQRKLLENADKTSAEINTMLLTSCVLSVNNEPSVGAYTVLSLGIGDRSKLVEEILSRNPGPRLGEVSKNCKACGESMSLPLSLVDLFRI